jgi:replicative DNA helicase
MPDGNSRLPREDLLPPHNLPAEQALLGAILTFNEVFNQTSEFLRAEHFYEPLHGRIFEAAGAIIRRGDLADAITLTGFAKTDERMRELGGEAYLVELALARAQPATARDYARIVHDLALRRALIGIGSEIEHSASSELDEPAAHLVERAEKHLFDLAENGIGNKHFISFAQALSTTITHAAAAFERDGGLSGIASGLSDLDDMLGGLHPSDLIIVAGRPSMGKTALATNIAFNVARRYRESRDETGQRVADDGGIVGFYSLEMSADQLAMRLLAEHSGISSHRIRRGEIEPYEFEQIRDAADEISAIPLHIDETGGITISALSARARRMKRMIGLDLLVVDYLQLVTTGGRGENRVQEVSEITQGLKALAKELNVPIIALSQLSRQVEQRDDKRPQLSDLRESGSIEQDADVVMFVYREAYYVGRREPKSKEGTEEYAAWQDEMSRAHGKAEIIIGKQRHGPIGNVTVAFEEKLTKFSNLAREAAYNERD